MKPPLTPNAWLRFDVVALELGRLPDVRRVLEVGAGGGAVGARLARRYDYVGLEPDPVSFSVAEQRLTGAGTIINGDISALGADATFDLVCAFEVLEHIEDDEKALRQWRERLRPGGHLMLSVPAHQRRFGPADEGAGHYRRYGRAQLVELLDGAGFEPIAVRCYGFPLGYLLEWARNLLARRREDAQPADMEERTASSGRLFQPTDRLAWVTWLATLPFRLLQRAFGETDLGTGFVVRARRRG
jgi:SAM-dependent methyltransferase